LNDRSKLASPSAALSCAYHARVMGGSASPRHDTVKGSSTTFI
jgi:hypothetical protein